MQWEEHSFIQQAYEALTKKKKVQFIIAPRRIEHIDRWLMLWPTNTRVVYASQDHQGVYDIMIVDSYGVLNNFYQLSDLVFVGGSLVKHGGQNVMEPAYYGKCIITGPYGYNFHEVIAMMVAEGCLLEVSDSSALVECMITLLNSPQTIMNRGVCARKFCEKLYHETTLSYKIWLKSIMDEKL